jgi:hypothetical protein
MSEGRRRARAVPLAMLLVSCGETESAPVPRGPSHTPAQIVYASESTDLADVYDMEGPRFNVRSKRRLDRPTDIGGVVVDCSTEEFRCFRSGLQVALPRRAPFPAAWSAAGMACRRSNPDEKQSMRVVCWFGKGWGTEVDFQPGRGITRYRRLCPQCQRGYYNLAGTTGLFAD